MTSPDSFAQPACLRADSVRIVREPVLVGLDAQDEGAIAVQPIVQDGVVRSIRIQCACGQEIAIECVYAEPDPPDEPPPSGAGEES